MACTLVDRGFMVGDDEDDDCGGRAKKKNQLEMFFS
jgi:hypothetical protein